MSDSYSVYVYRVLQKVDPDVGISSQGMAVMNSLVPDVIARLATAELKEAGRLARYNARKTVKAREVQTAARLLLPTGVLEGAVAAGKEAVEAHRTEKRGKAAADADAEEEEEVDEEVGAEDDVVGGAEAGFEGQEPVPAPQASLAFSLARLKRAIKEKTNMLVGAEATVYLAAVMEYVVGRILRPACECAREQSMLRITPRHVQLALRNDEPLGRFVADAVIQGAQLPSLPMGLFSPAGAAGALPGLPSLPSVLVPAALVPAAAQTHDEAVPGLRRALAAAGMELQGPGGFFANPPQAALPALAAAVAAFDISQDADELKDTLTHTLRHFSTSPC